MEFYGIRKAGADIDLIVCDADYQNLAKAHPENLRDIWGDLGVVVGEFEIWRSISFFDYDFFAKDAVCASSILVVSLDKLLFTRALVLEGASGNWDVEKYRVDFEKLVHYYYENFRNKNFLKEHLT